MELKSEQKIIRMSLILVIVAGMSFLGIWEVSITSGSSKSTVLATQIAFSGFGDIALYNPEKPGLFSTNIHVDNNLGFQISKPNNSWEIHSVLDEMSLGKLESLKTKGFLDGVFVEQNHDKKFIVTVFDVKAENFVLHDYVDNQIVMMESQNFKVDFEQVSPNNDWAIFAAENPENKYGEQLLFLKENRLYMLQYSGNSPQTLDSDQKEDFQLIMDSFEVI